ADACLRAAVGASEAITLPAGVTTTIFGAIVLVVLARSMRTAGPAQATSAARSRVDGRRRAIIVIACGCLFVAAAAIIALLSGDRFCLLGDVALWLSARAAPVIDFALDSRAPRVAAALAAGAALALSGTLVQASARNPLAEPGLLGITGGAGLGAVILTTAVPGATVAPISTVWRVAALPAVGRVYALGWGVGLIADRLVLVGIVLCPGYAALSPLSRNRAGPGDAPARVAWLPGSPPGRV